MSPGLAAWQCSTPRLPPRLAQERMRAGARRPLNRARSQPIHGTRSPGSPASPPQASWASEFKNSVGGEKTDRVMKQAPAEVDVLQVGFKPEFQQGDRVRVDRLECRTDLNGCVGSVVGFDFPGWRYKVLMDDGSKLAFSPKHLSRDYGVYDPGSEEPSTAFWNIGPVKVFHKMEDLLLDRPSPQTVIMLCGGRSAVNVGASLRAAYMQGSDAAILMRQIHGAGDVPDGDMPDTPELSTSSASSPYGVGASSPPGRSNSSRRGQALPGRRVGEREASEDQGRSDSSSPERKPPVSLESALRKSSALKREWPLRVVDVNSANDAATVVQSCAKAGLAVIRVDLCPGRKVLEDDNAHIRFLEAADLSGEVLLVFGDEEGRLPDEIAVECQDRVVAPVEVDELTGIDKGVTVALYERARQRRDAAARAAQRQRKGAGSTRGDSPKDASANTNTAEKKERWLRGIFYSCNKDANQRVLLIDLFRQCRLENDFSVLFGMEPLVEVEGETSLAAKKRDALIDKLGEELLVRLQKQLAVACELHGGGIAGLKQVLKKYDKDGNGMISSVEFKQVIRRELKVKENDMSDKDILRLIHALDDDDSKLLSIVEIYDFVERGSATLFQASAEVGQWKSQKHDVRVMGASFKEMNPHCDSDEKASFTEFKRWYLGALRHRVLELEAEKRKNQQAEKKKHDQFSTSSTLPSPVDEELRSSASNYDEVNSSNTRLTTMSSNTELREQTRMNFMTKINSNKAVRMLSPYKDKDKEKDKDKDKDKGKTNSFGFGFFKKDRSET